MTHTERQHVPSVISDFVTSYMDNLMSGACRDDQYAIAFQPARGGTLFLALDPDPSVEHDPRSVTPAEQVPVALALFVPRMGRVHFRTPATCAGEFRHVELEDPIYIRFDQGEGEQLWMLSLAEDGGGGDTLRIHRADPATVRFQPCTFLDLVEPSFH